MKKNSLGAACATVLVALVGGLAAPSTSHALLHGGVYDPSNVFYAWSGNHLFDIADACLLGNGWKTVNHSSDNYACSGRLIGGDVTVINKQPDPDFSQTRQFSSILDGAINGNDPDQPFVWGIYVEDGLVRGIDTLETEFFGFGVANESTHGGDWSLEWTSGRATSTYCALFFFANICNIEGRPGQAAASTALNSPLPDPSAAVFLRNVVSGDPNGKLPLRSDSVTFQQVPEPTTVTLVLAALGAGWLARRRKR